MIFNLSFDPRRLTYDTTYDNSLHFSPAFQRFALDLASRLVQTYGIRSKNVIEIGCGKGEFLAMLCMAGCNEGIGFDPSYSGEAQEQSAGSMTFVRDLYSEAQIDRPVDLICCRHVLEHHANPREFVGSLRRMLNDRPGAVLYFEVPNAESVLGGDTLWDIIYPHCSYFSSPPLERLFRDARFHVLRAEPCFGGQFLCIEARPDGAESEQAEYGAAVERVAALASRFEQQFKESVSYWSGFIANALRSKRRVALWGSGAKGTMFLNTVATGAEIEFVVDLNPRKQGMYVPGTGQLVASPEQIREVRPDMILISNPIYESEIREIVRNYGVAADLIPILPVSALSATS
jgi:SAM-dependent methyltransferase